MDDALQPKTMEDPLQLDFQNAEIDSPEIKLENENYSIEPEQIVHVDIPQLNVTVIKTEIDDVDPKLEAMPIVYTSRLDHMDALHSSFVGRSTKTVINDIEEESKPDYNTKKIKNYKMETSFRWVQLRISQLKRKFKALSVNSSDLNSLDSEEDENIASTKLSNKAFEPSVTTTLDNQDEENVGNTELSDTASLRNLKLLKKCKPLSVVVEKVDSKINTLSEYGKKKGDLPSRENIVYIIKDKNFNETYIFYVGNKVLVEFHKMKGINDLKLMRYIERYQKSSRSIKIINICCWYRRQHITSLFYYQSIPVNLRKKPHNCLYYGKCVCCCRGFNQHKVNEYDITDLTCSKNSPEDTSVVLSEDIQIQDFEQNVTDLTCSKNSQGDISFVLPEDMEIQDLEQELSDTFVQMKQNTSDNKYGYNYNWLEDLLTKDDSNNLINVALNYNKAKDKVKKIVQKTKRTGTLFKRFYSNNLTEYFELNSYGDIKMYGKNLNSAIIQEEFDDVNVPSADYKICCWRKRDIIIKNNFSFLPDLARFLSTPHSCVAGKCTCCCTSLSRVRLGHMTLPRRTTPSHTINVTKVNSTNEETDQVCNIITGLPHNVPVETVKRNLTKEIPNITTPQPFLHTYSQVVSQAPKIPIAANQNTQASNVDSMVMAILEKFKNVRLTIGDDGKIAATLDTPISSLSTTELTILANILTNAQKQVQVIGSMYGPKETNTSHTNLPNSPITSTSSAIHNKPQLAQAAKSTVTCVKIPPKPPAEIPMEPRDQIYSNFATIFKRKSVTSLVSFANYINSTNKEIQREQSVDDTVTQTPVIANVFSLKDVDSNSTNSNAKLWTDEVEVSKRTVTHKIGKPASIQNHSTRKSPSFSKEALDTPTLKRKSGDETLVASKIRVVDPSKLGLTKNFKEPVADIFTPPTPTQYPANRMYLKVSAGNNVPVTSKMSPVKLQFQTSSTDSPAMKLVPLLPVALTVNEKEAASKTHGRVPPKL